MSEENSNMQEPIQPDLVGASVVMTGAAVVATSPSPARSLYEYYKLQLLQILLGIILTVLNTYIQMGINKLIQSVMSNTNTIQKSYTPSISSLSELSMKYANGIIGVNSESFLINMQLISKFNIGNINTNSLPEGVTIAHINTLLLQATQALGNNPNNHICLITVFDPVISITIPGFSQPITTETTKQITRINNYDVIIKNGFVYVIDSVRQKQYVFKHSNKIVEWFFYKDLKNQFSIEMTDSVIAIGNSRFKILAQAFDEPTVTTAVPFQSDPRGTQY